MTTAPGSPSRLPLNREASVDHTSSKSLELHERGARAFRPLSLFSRSSSPLTSSCERRAASTDNTSTTPFEVLAKVEQQRQITANKRLQDLQDLCNRTARLCLPPCDRKPIAMTVLDAAAKARREELLQQTEVEKTDEEDEISSASTFDPKDVDLSNALFVDVPPSHRTGTVQDNKTANTESDPDWDIL